MASAALRLTLEAKRRGIRLANVTFITGGESLTPAKVAAIEAVGARALFSFAEFGTAAYGCASPAGPDDMHTCKDAVAVIQRRRPFNQIGSEVDALLFTSLRPDARRTLLNVESGDYAKITQNARSRRVGSNMRCHAARASLPQSRALASAPRFIRIALGHAALKGLRPEKKPELIRRSANVAR